MHNIYGLQLHCICVHFKIITTTASTDQPKFGFGAKTDLKCSFGSVSVAVTPHFTFGFSHNYMADDRNWSE